MQKVFDLWPGKKGLLIWRNMTRIPFKVLSLELYILLAALVPLLETLPESICRNEVQLGRRFPYNVFSWLKFYSFQWHFQLRVLCDMSWATSRWSCLCFTDSSFGTNFADTLFITEFSVKIECIEPTLIPTSPASSRTATRQSRMTKVNTLSMFSSFLVDRSLSERGSLSTDV